MRILCEAVSFGFGPVSKLLSLCELLNQKHSLSFIGSGCSLSLAQKTNIFEKIIVLDTTSTNHFNDSVPFSGYDVVLSVMNPLFGRAALENGCKLIVIDSLFYMWDKIDPVWEECDLLIIQSFFEEKKRLLSTHNFTNAQIVGPIISTQIEPKKQNVHNTLLINFGGADYPYIKNFNDIQLFIRKLTLEIERIDIFDEKIITIGPRCLQSMKELERNGFKVRSFSHDEFLFQLSKSSTLLTIPGLTSSFESFCLAIPTLFLPPLNYSQFLNLRTFRSLELSHIGSHWDDYFPNLNTNGLPEEEGVQMIESLIAQAYRDPSILTSIVKSYEIVLEDTVNIKLMTDKQNNFYQSLGGCGTHEAVKLIEGLSTDG